VQTQITFKDVTFAYNNTPILENVNLDLREHTFIGVVGPNGGGKTTMLKLILGLLKPQFGRIEVFGHPPSAVCGKIGYVPQSTQFDSQFPVTVLDVVLMGRAGKACVGRYSSSDIESADVALGEAEMSAFRNRGFFELSGGQRQRVLIARALAADAELLLMDEPTAHIDQVAEKNFYDILKRLQSRLSILLVSHDVGFISSFVSGVLCVNRKVAFHPVSELSGAVMSEMYGGNVAMIRHDHDCIREECTHD